MEINLRYILLSSKRNCEEVILQDYLSTIYRLEDVFGIAKTSKIAEELNVTPATVTKMLKKLEKSGYIRYDKYRGTVLTESGKKIAMKVIWKHRVCEYFLQKFLNIDMYRIHVYAHLMEHLPDDLILKIYEMSGKPTICPHGNPINVELKCEYKGKPLIEYVHETNYPFRIVRILGEFAKALQLFEKYSIRVGCRLRIIEYRKDVPKVKLEIEDTNRIVEIPIDYTALIEVEKIS